jgi:hypothetical protein
VRAVAASAVITARRAPDLSAIAPIAGVAKTFAQIAAGRIRRSPRGEARAASQIGQNGSWMPAIKNRGIKR